MVQDFTCKYSPVLVNAFPLTRKILDFCSSIAIWASAETGFTIFAASIPALRILIIRIRSSYQESEGNEGTYPLSSKSGIETTQEVTVERGTSEERNMERDTEEYHEAHEAHEGR